MIIIPSAHHINHLMYSKFCCIPPAIFILERGGQRVKIYMLRLLRALSSASTSKVHLCGVCRVSIYIDVIHSCTFSHYNRKVGPHPTAKSPLRIKISTTVYCTISATMAKEFVESEIKASKVTVFSATYCPYCNMAKEALNSTGTKFTVIELDKRS